MADIITVQERLKLGFDPRALREKYDLERDTRLRPEGNQQYLRADEEFLDTKAARGVSLSERDPVTLQFDVLVVGGGFAGLQTAAHLRQAGVDNFRIVERASDFGGNWFWNRYPGAACDSESYCYLPLLEETGYIPSSRYPDAEEIQHHAVRIGHHFHLYEVTLFGTNVTSMVWDEDESRWTVESDRGDLLHPRFVVLAGGETITELKLPKIPGLRGFEGHSFHTARWDYGYTGGGVSGDLHKLRGKRVAIIGTGCSAVQIVPHVAESAEHLYVIQRTPALVIPRENTPTDPEWARSLEAGWQQKRMADTLAVVEGRSDEFVDDHGFADLFYTLARLNRATAAAAEEARLELTPGEVLEISNMQYMEGVRTRIEGIVGTSETAEALKPWYASWCKRPSWNDHYLETFNRPNVTLLNAPKGVERVTPTGVVVDGTEHDVDLIIYGSGFTVGHSSIFKLARFPMIGRDGATLDAHWADGYRTLHGMTVHGFPNYFQLTVLGNALGANYLFGNGKQASHIVWIINECLENGINSIMPTREAEDQWRIELDDSYNLEINPRAGLVNQGRAECTPGYFNSEGDALDKKGLYANTYGFGVLAYLSILQRWRDTAEFPGLIVTNDGAAGARLRPAAATDARI